MSFPVHQEKVFHVQIFCLRALVAVLFFTGLSSRAAIIIENASFEDPGSIDEDTYTTPFGKLDPKTGVPGWEFTPSQTDSYAGLVCEEGPRLGGNKAIPAGSQAAFVQGTGSLWQSLDFPAGDYVVHFMARGRPIGGVGSNPIAVSIDEKPLGLFTPKTSQWDAFTSSACTLSAGHHKVQFAGTVPYHKEDRTSWIDAVSITKPGDAPNPIAPAATDPSKTNDIVFMGDSITAGATLPQAGSQNPCCRCAEELREKYNVEVHFSNQGHSGHTTVDFLPSADPQSDWLQAEKAATRLVASNPGLLIFSIMLGTNDSADRGPNGSPVSPSKYGGNMHTIIDHLLADFPESVVFVQYPIWYSPNTRNASDYGETGLKRLRSYRPELSSLIMQFAKEHPGHVFAGDKNAFDHFAKTYKAELTPENGRSGIFYLHPNPEGAEALGRYWATSIASALSMPPK